MHQPSQTTKLAPLQSFFTQSQKLNGHPIPNLLLLNDMVALVKNTEVLPDLSKTIVIGVQHMLETTVSLFKALIALGIKPDNMYFSGKCYSSSPVIEDEVHHLGIHLIPSTKPEEPGEYDKYCRRDMDFLWIRCIEKIELLIPDRIIVLDEGGMCLASMPEFLKFKYHVAAIEQTRAGLYSELSKVLPFPLIDVASCAAKRILEPAFIAEAIVNRFSRLLPQLDSNNKTFGIIGNGTIGYALCCYLLYKNKTVIVYDSNESAFNNIEHKNFYRFGGIKEVIASADIILGCTGKDVTEGIANEIISLVNNSKTFISCSSKDVEFLSLLRLIAQEKKSSRIDAVTDTLSDLKFSCNGNPRSVITVLQGGFPINFDRSPVSVPADKIEMTRGLLFGAFIQAVLFASKPIADGRTINRGEHLVLDPHIQKFVALHWLKRVKGNNPDMISDNTQTLFKEMTWITKNSGGVFRSNIKIESCFDSLVIRTHLCPETYRDPIPRPRL